MTKKWYEELLDPITKSAADTLLVVDSTGLVNRLPINEFLQRKYTIEYFKTELQLRKLIRNKDQNLLVLFKDRKDIPYDISSAYATVEIRLDDIFPLLNTEVLSDISFEEYQAIYEEYKEEIEGKRYEKLSKSQTEEFISKITSSETLKKKRRIEELHSKLYELLESPVTDCPWGEVSSTYGEMSYLLHDSDTGRDIEKVRSLMKDRFEKYVSEYYEDLVYDLKAKINSNVLNLIFNESRENNALICFDCMGFEEYNVIKECLQKDCDLVFEENYSFSILPSETNYSISALFSGEEPKKILDSGLVKNMHWKNSQKLFKHALNEKWNIEKNSVYFHRCGLPDEIPIGYDSFKDFSNLGLVLAFIDRLTHEKLMTKKRLISSIREILENNRLEELIKSLLDQDFRVFLLSDHGSIYAKGNGTKISRDLSEHRAERCAIFNKKELANEYKNKLAEEYENDRIILRQFKNIVGDYYLLLLAGEQMFGRKNNEGLTHGGISIEEVVVPFVEVKRK